MEGLKQKLADLTSQDRGLQASRDF